MEVITTQPQSTVIANPRDQTLLYAIKLVIPYSEKCLCAKHLKEKLKKLRINNINN